MLKTASDPFNLDRFNAAQEPVLGTVLDELKAGRKRSHWIWYVFPQLRGLGASPNADFYGIGSLDEARAYLAHPVLGARLRLSVRTLLDVEETSLHAILGSPDDLKFSSSMTLFALADETPESLFQAALHRFCQGRMDEKTLALLGR